MKNKVKSGFLSYLMTFLGLILGVIIVILSIMIISPGVKVFGYQFLNNRTEKNYYLLPDGETTLISAYQNDEFDTIEISGENYTIDKKEITSGKYDININREPNDSNFSIKVKSRSHGFSNKKEANRININYYLEGKTLKMTIKEPYYNLTTSSYIEINVCVPNTKEFDTTKLNFKLKTTSGDIVVGHNPQKLSIQNINAETTKGKIIVNDCVKILNNQIQLKTEKGSIHLSNQNDYSLSTPRDILLTSVSGKIKTGSVKGNIKITTDKSICEIDGNIDGNVNYSSKYGILKTKNINGWFKAEETVKVPEIILGEVFGDVTMISGETSNVTIAKTNANVRIKTQKGNITIKDINGHTSSTDYIELSNTSGNINYINNSNNKIKCSTESGKITATYNKLWNPQEISSTKGKITVNMKKGVDVKILAETTKDIKFSWNGGKVLTGKQQVTLGSPLGDIKTLSIKSTKGNIQVDEFID